MFIIKYKQLYTYKSNKKRGERNALASFSILISLLLCFFSQFLLMISNQLALDITRNKLITCKLHNKRSTTSLLTNFPQCRRVRGHFLQRHFGDQFFITGFAVHTHNHGTASLQVTSHGKVFNQKAHTPLSRRFGSRKS